MMVDGSFEKLGWEDANLNLENIIGFNLINLDRLNSITPETKISISNWESLSDYEIISKVDTATFLSNDIYVVTDISYLKKIVFKVRSDNLIDSFISAYVDEYSESFFNGDVIIISPERQKLLFFHHAGFWFTYSLPVA